MRDPVLLVLGHLGVPAQTTPEDAGRPHEHRQHDYRQKNGQQTKGRLTSGRVHPAGKWGPTRSRRVPGAERSSPEEQQEEDVRISPRRVLTWHERGSEELPSTVDLDSECGRAWKTLH